MLNPVGHPGCSFSTSLSKARYIRSVSSRCIYCCIHPWKEPMSLELYRVCHWWMSIWLAFYIQNPTKKHSPNRDLQEIVILWSSAKINIIVESRALPTFAVSAWLFTLETNGLLPRVSRFWKTHESRTVHIQKSLIGSWNIMKKWTKTPVQMCERYLLRYDLGVLSCLFSALI